MRGHVELVAVKPLQDVVTSGVRAGGHGGGIDAHPKTRGGSRIWNVTKVLKEKSEFQEISPNKHALWEI